MKQLMVNIIFLSLILNQSVAQKPAITDSDYSSWSRLIYGRVSADGRYCFWIHMRSSLGKRVLTAKDLHRQWEAVYENVSGESFSPNGHHIGFLKDGDTLYIIELKNKTQKVIPKVDTYQFYKTGRQEWLIYKKNTADKQLVCQSLQTGKEETFTHVRRFWLSEAGKLLMCGKEQSSSSSSELQSYDFSNGQRRLVWKSGDMQATESVTQLCFDKSGKQMLFYVGLQTDDVHQQLWYHIENGSPAEKVLDAGSLSQKMPGYTLSDKPPYGFVNKDKCFGFFVHKIEAAEEDDLPFNLEIWNSGDAMLKSQQIQMYKRQDDEALKKNHLCILDFDKKGLMLVDTTGEKTIIPLVKDPYAVDSTFFIERMDGDYTERYWNPRAIPRYFLFECQTGTRIPIDGGVLNNISPGGKYMVYFDVKADAYFCYNTLTRSSYALTRSIKTDWIFDKKSDVPLLGREPIGVAGWSQNDEVYLYDKFDIWRIDLSTRRPPVNITRHYGAKHNIIFRFGLYSPNQVIDQDTEVILSAFNNSNKENGFFKGDMRGRLDPQCLYMGPYMFFFRDKSLGEQPVKAQDANVFLVSRQSAMDAPNFCVTTDFVHYRRLTDYAPNRSVNWLTTELLNIAGGRADTIKAVLYKPEDFNAEKRYPVIIHYYERLSEFLHVFRFPQPSIGGIDIPTFVSRGYLVLTPDIYFGQGSTGSDGLDVILRSADAVCQLKYVDSTKMGVQGHSFGGYLTEYVVTHTGRFAAACAGAAVSDMVSDYGLISHGKKSRNYFYESTQNRLGATMWDNLDVYIENSPIFYVDKVSTPLLILHNFSDEIVPFSQGLEMFNAMRRLGKRAWLLNYVSESHMLTGEEGLDYNRRLLQFFDHYLKDSLPPRWMTNTRMFGPDVYNRSLRIDSMNVMR